MGADTEIVWQTTAHAPLPIRYWGGDYVVYNPLSGDTHILDIATGELLKAVANERLPTGDLCRRLAEFLEVPNDVNMAQTVDRILKHLDELGLIEPDASC